MQERITAVRQLLASWHVDAVLITSQANRRWLSGFTGSNGQLLITADQALLATDFRYMERAKSEAPAFTPFLHQRTQADTEKLISSVNAHRIGLEAEHVTLAQYQDFAQLEEIEWVPLETTVEPLRAIKTAAEIAGNRAAAAITDMAMAQVNELARLGISEKGAGMATGATHAGSWR